MEQNTKNRNMLICQMQRHMFKETSNASNPGVYAWNKKLDPAATSKPWWLGG